MEILRTEPITSERWLNLFRRTFRSNGKVCDWVFASRKPHPPCPASGFDAVVIVPLILQDGLPPRLVVTREYRVPLGAYEYGFPAGLAEPGESAEAVARRELKEETGFEVLEVKRVSPPVFSSTGLTDEAAVIVYVTAHAPDGCQPCRDEHEDIEVLLLDFAEVSRLCDSGELMNSKAWQTFYMYQQLGRLV